MKEGTWPMIEEAFATMTISNIGFSFGLFIFITMKFDERRYKI